MPECPICEKKLEWRGSDSYKKHIREKHRSYWLEVKRLQLLAVSTLIISLVLTFLVATVFFSFSPDVTAYSAMGLAALFLAFSAVFTLKERTLPKKYGKVPSKGKPTRRRAGRGSRAGPSD